MSETVTQVNETTQQIVRSRTCGLKDFYIALVQSNTATAYTAGTPVKLARAIKAKIDEKWTSEKIYSDDNTEEVITSYEGTDVELEINVSTKLENMKSAYNEKGGGMKGIVSATFTGIKDTMNSLMSTANTLTGGKLDSIKSSFSTKLNGALSTVGSVMESIRAKFSEKMESAKTAVSNAIDRIKGFFNFEWSLPHLKMPHFSISGSFSLNPPSVPSFGVEWYKTGGIMTSPTVFGMNGTRLMVGGEAGAEAILPLAEFYTELNSMLDRKLKAINQNVNAFIEVHNYIDGDEVASRTTEKVSDNLAIATKKRR